MAGIVAHTVDDGQGRYGSRTRVNRIVYEWELADLSGADVVEAVVPINGEIHTIWLDVSSSKLTANADVDTVKGDFKIECYDYTAVAGDRIGYCNTITSLDFTNQSTRVYKFQTNEGAAMGTMEHALSISPGLSGHSTPAAPKVGNVTGTATVITKNQPWTGRVCGNVVFSLGLTTAPGVFWAGDTGKIRLTVLYS